MLVYLSQTTAADLFEENDIERATESGCLTVELTSPGLNLTILVTVKQIWQTLILASARPNLKSHIAASE